MDIRRRKNQATCFLPAVAYSDTSPKNPESDEGHSKKTTQTPLRNINMTKHQRGVNTKKYEHH